MNESEIEQRVEAMQGEGRSIMAEAIAVYKPVAIVAAYSSGDDSVVTTHFTINNYSGSFVFGADPIFGLDLSRQHRVAVCNRFCWQLEVERAVAEGPPKQMRLNHKLVPFDPAILPAGRWTDGENAYEEFVLNHGFPGRGKPQHARMYQRLKERPFRRLIKRLGGAKARKKPKVLIVSGIRQDESSIRAGYKRAYAEGYFGDVWVNPFYYRNALDFEAWRQEFGLPRNPAKARCGISGECGCGTFLGLNERQAFRIVEPQFADHIDRLECRVKENGFPWGYGESPPQWWVNERKDKKCGQLQLFEQLPIFQPMCVGCNNGRR